VHRGEISKQEKDRWVCALFSLLPRSGWNLTLSGEEASSGYI
jgi:hypothetical protein